MASGPIIGGLVVEALGWRWAFAFNVPLSLLLAGAAMAAVPANRGHKGTHRFDRAGVLLVTLGMAGLVFGIIEGGATSFTEPAVLVALCLAAVAGVAFVLVERRSSSPMLDLTLFRSRAFTASRKRTDQMVDDLPRRDALVCVWVPVRG